MLFFFINPAFWFWVPQMVWCMRQTPKPVLIFLTNYSFLCVAWTIWMIRISIQRTLVVKLTAGASTQKKIGLWGFFLKFDSQKKPYWLLEFSISMMVCKKKMDFKNIIWFWRFVWTENGLSENQNWFFRRFGKDVCYNNVLHSLCAFSPRTLL